jgi:hypothetical protein
MSEELIVNAETGEILESAGLSIVQAHESAAMDVQVATAQKLGRSIKHFQADLESWACATQEIAEECTYVLRKGGNRIIGPSIRFAELLQVAYRHIVVDTFIEEETHSYVVVGAMARDLFRNVAVRARVRRNVLKSDGKTRYSQDVIQSTVQAAASLALRNAIIRLIPKALWLPVWLKSRDVAQGTGGDGKPVIPFSERVERAFKYLQTFGATPDQVLAYLGKDSKQDLDADDVADLANKARSIRAGEIDVDKAFPVPGDDTHGKAEADAVADRIKRAAAQPQEQAPKKAAKKKAAAKRAAPTPQEEADAKAPRKPQEAAAAPPASQVEEPADADDVPAVDL